MWVTDHWIVHSASLCFFDIGRPLFMVADWIYAQADDLGIPLGKLRLEPGHGAELGRAYRCKVLRVGKQDRPAITDPFMKTNRALRGLGGEVGSRLIDKRHVNALSRCAHAFTLLECRMFLHT